MFHKWEIHIQINMQYLSLACGLSLVRKLLSSKSHSSITLRKQESIRQLCYCVTKNIQQDKLFTHASSPAGQLQQRLLKATVEARKRPWERELLHLAPETKPWAVLGCSSWGGIY